MQHLWYNSTLFYQQDKEGGINPTFESFCLRKICGKPAKTIAYKLKYLIGEKNSCQV